MLITPVDEYNNLFQVQNLVPESLLTDITSTSWHSISRGPTPGQAQYIRTLLNDQELGWITSWNNYIKLIQPQIETAINVQLESHSNNKSYWWHDTAGFNTGLHIDNNKVTVALHMYWEGPANYGTTFYNTNSLTDVRYQFKFKPNTGYISINNPSQWHGMLTPLPKNTTRITSYTHFSPVK